MHGDWTFTRLRLTISILFHSIYANIFYTHPFLPSLHFPAGELEAYRVCFFPNYLITPERYIQSSPIALHKEIQPGCIHTKTKKFQPRGRKVAAWRFPLLRYDLNIHYVFLLSDLDEYIYIQGDGYFGRVWGRRVRHS